MLPLIIQQQHHGKESEHYGMHHLVGTRKQGRGVIPNGSGISVSQRMSNVVIIEKSQ